MKAEEIPSRRRGFVSPLGYDAGLISFKRRVLSALGKDLLLDIGRGLELDVTTRMGVEELRDALAKSKRAKLDAIVQESLPRDTLKEICDAVGLDDTGKEKAALVERILAAGGGKTANGVGYKSLLTAEIRLADCPGPESGQESGQMARFQRAHWTSTVSMIARPRRAIANDTSPDDFTFECATGRHRCFRARTARR